MKHLGAIVFVAAGLASASAAVGHEFWIEAEDYTVAPQGRIAAALMVGQSFEGSSFAYIPSNFRRFDIGFQGESAPVEGRMGDRPAVNVAAPGEGLVTLIHVTRDYELEWDSWDAFAEFVGHKGADWVLDAHAARGLGEDVVEGYSRYGKALVAAGDGAGEDRRWGLQTEIVALENPYGDGIGDGMEVQLFYDDAPRANALIEIFAKDQSGSVETSTVRTDPDGIATVPVAPGRTYLLDAVVLREPGPEMAASLPSAIWESLWASLTFAVPD